MGIVAAYCWTSLINRTATLIAVKESTNRSVHRIAFVLKNGLVFAMLLIALGVSTASLIFTDFEMTSNATQVFQTDNDPGVGAAIAWTFTAIKT